MNFAPRRVLAAVWAVLFAAVHALRAAGSPSGLGPGAAGRITGWFRDYDVAVAIGCLVGAAVALWGRRWMNVSVAVLLLARGALGVGQAGLGLLHGDDIWSPTLWVEPFLLLGGVLFALAARSARSPVRARRPGRVRTNR